MSTTVCTQKAAYISSTLTFGQKNKKQSLWVWRENQENEHVSTQLSLLLSHVYRSSLSENKHTVDLGKQKGGVEDQSSFCGSNNYTG